MKRLWFVPLLLLGGCLWGCKGMGPRNIEEAMVLVDKMRVVAVEQNLDWDAELRWDGRISGFQEAAIGINTGVNLVFRMHGRAMPPPK